MKYMIITIRYKTMNAVLLTLLSREERHSFEIIPKVLACKGGGIEGCGKPIFFHSYVLQSSCVGTRHRHGIITPDNTI